jgi:hypothetical protein
VRIAASLSGKAHAKLGYFGPPFRVRYSRLSRVRRQLGYPGSLPFTDHEKRLSSDPNYMLVDVVTNWVADGLMLCFLHAAMDLNSVDDCDEAHPSHWSNWCQTSADLLRSQIDTLHRALSTRLPTSVSPLDVFQVLDSSSQELLLTWPYDRAEFVNNPHNVPVVHPFDLVKLASTALQSQDSMSKRAKTTCTRRFKSSQRIGTDRRVNSIFIPHGKLLSIIDLDADCGTLNWEGSCQILHRHRLPHPSLHDGFYRYAG